MNNTQPAGSMSSTPTCPACGAALPAGALGGLCPACLLREGGSHDSATEAGSPGFQAPTIEDVARLFPQLEIIELLGKGGMGAVYKARQPALDRFVALKLLPSRLGAGPASAERFNREARALARLNHPHIVAVYDFGQVSVANPAATGGVGAYQYFLMECVDGLNLRQLQRRGRLAPREALAIVPQLCDALQYAHDEGIVHRDIKPENVLVDRRGRVKIADFGLAKLLDAPAADARLTVEGQVMGTPHYMAPEQVEHPRDVDHRADIFSLGVVFYELLTGELPLGKFPPPSRKVQVDVRLDDVVLRALEKEPERRYQRVGEVKSAVETITSAGDATAPAGKTAPAAAGRDVRTARGVLGLPWVHVASGIDPATGRPRVARGVVAVGPTAIGVVAVGRVACGLIACGLFAGGGMATGLASVGLSVVGLLALGVEMVGLLGLGVHHAVGFGVLGRAGRDAATVGALTAALPVGWLLLLFLMALLLSGLFLRHRCRRLPALPARPRLSRSQCRRGWIAGILVFLLVLATASVTTALLPRTFRATGRMEITRSNPGLQFDPYFLQTEFEAIQSARVLNQVVDQLHLTERWGRRYAQGSMSPTEAVVLILRGLNCQSIRLTALVEVSFHWGSPTEAAEVVQAIMGTYARMRNEDSAKAGVAVPFVRVSIVDPPFVPLVPVRPNPLLNVTLGALIGALFGILTGWAVARWSPAAGPEDGPPRNGLLARLVWMTGVAGLVALAFLGAWVSARVLLYRQPESLRPRGASEVSATTTQAIQAIRDYGGFVRTNSAGAVRIVSLVYDEAESGERRECFNRTDDVLVHLAAFPQLEELQLIEEQATDRAMAWVAQCTNLHRLMIWNARQLTDAGVNRLAALRTLGTLHIDHSRIGDASLGVFARMPSLQRLALQGHNFTDAGLQHLGSATGLQSLWVGNGGGRITDAGLAALRGLTNLTELELQHCPITDAGLQSLKGLTQLRRLFLDETKVTPAGVAELQSAIPALEVHW